MSFDHLQGIFLTYGIYSILVVCGLFFLVIWLFGFLMLVIAVRLSGRNFRAKGFLRKPSGSDWIPFLLKRHYEGFEGNGARWTYRPRRRCCFGRIGARFRPHLTEPTVAYRPQLPRRFSASRSCK
jgi:hypothetical protein